MRFMLETNETTLTLYPNELDSIHTMQDGAILRIGEMVIQCIIESTDQLRKRMMTLRVAGTTAILAVLSIFQGDSYTIRTGVAGNHVLVSKNTLPSSIPNQVGWAFGFSSRNRMTLDRLQNTYQQFQLEYQIDSGACSDNAAKPVYKVFCPWLHATYRADADGNYKTVPVYWAVNGMPTVNEALDLMLSMSEKCSTEHNRSRIDYVMHQLIGA